VNYIPKQMTVEQLAGGFKTLVTRLYSDEFTRHRRSNFKQLLRKLHMEEEN